MARVATRLLPSPPRFADAAEMVAVLAPAEPVYCLRPHVLRATAQAFCDTFPGEVLFAVKCNPDPHFLDALHAGGIRHFDTASLPEIALIRARYAEAHVHYMHPVKPREAIGRAAREFGVTHFVVDHPDELDKVVAQAGSDVTVVVRLATARGAAVYDLGGKFGTDVEGAAALLLAAARRGCRVGLCFHVGSQCLTPSSYTAALRQVGEVLRRAPVELAVLDVGGGFPVAYVGATPPPLADYVAAIRAGLAELPLSPGCRLWCEPGRALVAAGASVVVRVELRRDHLLYINDGVYGSLNDMVNPGIRFPVRLIRPGRAAADELAPFTLFGPTCDPVDVLPGPFWLPADLRPGDYLEIGQAGAYSLAVRTGFNGFYPDALVEVADPAFLPDPDTGEPSAPAWTTAPWAAE